MARLPEPTAMDLSARFSTARPIVGMVHLPPLPGAPGFRGDRERIAADMRRDAERLVAGGVDALMLENYGDVPFYPEDVPKHVVATMASLATELTGAVNVPVGINVLRNDAEAALSVAAAAGADFVRVNVHAGSRVTDQGVVHGRAFETVRLRDRLDADVAILADVSVKHSTALGEDRFDEEFSDVVERGLADGTIISGRATGDEADLDRLRRAAELRDSMEENEDEDDRPAVFVGSGTTHENVEALLGLADGAIVGTAFKEGGETTNPVSVERVESFMETVRALR